MTRSGPAKLLALTDRGHLREGARADVAIYRDEKNRTAMFARAKLVLKDGETIVEDGEIVAWRSGRTLELTVESDKAMVARSETYLQDRFGAGLKSFPYPTRPPEAGRCFRRSHVARRTSASRGDGLTEMTDLTLTASRWIDTFAEAFDVAGTAIIITNDTAKWAMIAAVTHDGFATSVIGCGAEAGIDCELSPNENAGRAPGVRVLLFGFEPNGLKDQLLKRVGQCILTCPGTACYAGVDGPTKIKLGGAIRYFGDGFAVAKRLPTPSPARPGATGASRSWTASSSARTPSAP